MPKICPLFSGSSGNCTYVATTRGGLLIDAGVSAKRIVEALTARSIDPATLAGIFVTHEHTDHTNGIRVLAKKYGLPVYASYGTLLKLEPSLDAAIPLREMTAAGVECADMEIRHELCGCKTVLLESNHDLKMLREGPYPYPLKERILSAHGHLSNDACAALLPYLLESGTVRFLLGHLSRENNTPKLAELTAKSRLAAAGMQEFLDYRLLVAAPCCEDAPIIL